MKLSGLHFGFKRGQMTSITDVAKHAGVSIKTVSRVLNNEKNVKDATRERVFSSVEVLNYVPSASARNLRSKRSYTLHLIAHTDEANSYVNAIQAGALRTSQKFGYNLIWTYLDPEVVKLPGKLEAWCDNLASKMKPDGVILVSPYSNHEDLNSHLSRLNVPVVRIGPNNLSDKNITLKIDEKLAASDATHHLIKLGHKRISFIRGIENHPATRERFMGYRAALSKADISFDEDIVFPGEFSFVSGMAAGEKIIAMLDRPTAVFAANDEMAVGVIVAAHKNRVKIPEDISIIGFDNSEMSERIWPALTTINQPQCDYGAHAVEILIQRLGRNGKNGDDEDQQSQVLMDYRLIERDSTGPKA